MGFLDWFIEQFRLREPSVNAISKLQVSAVPNVPLTPTYDVKRLTDEGYRRNAIIFACIKQRMTGASQVTLVPKLVNRDGEKEELERNHPLARILRKPNPEQSHRQWLKEMVLHIDAGGGAYVHKVRNGRGAPLEMWNLRPDRTEIIPDARGYVSRYLFPADERHRASELPFQDVVHIKEIDPLDNHYGLSKIAVLARHGDIDNEMADYIRAILLNSGVPASGMKIKESSLSPSAKRDLQRNWRDQFGRHENGLADGHGAGGVAIFDHDVDWIKMGFSLDEFMAPEMVQYAEIRLCAPFGVPPILIGSQAGLEHATYSNAEQAEDHFWNNTEAPLLWDIADQLTMDLAGEWGDQYVIEPDFSEVRALQEDQDARSSRAVTEWEKGIVRLNEARALAGHDALDDDDLGDSFLWQIQGSANISPVEVLPEGMAPTPPPVAPVPPAQLPSGGDPDPDDEDNDELETQARTRQAATEPEWRALHKAIDLKHLAMRRAVSAGITAARDGLETRALRNAYAVRDEMAIVEVVSRTWRANALPVLNKRLGRHFGALHELGADSANRQIPPSRQGVGPSEVFVDLGDDAARAAAESQVAELVTGISSQTRDVIREAVDAMFTQGISAEEAVARIKGRLGLTGQMVQRLDTFEKRLKEKGVTGATLAARLERFSRRLVRERAFMIAETEGVRAVSEGQASLWDEAVRVGVLDRDVERFWITTEDNRVCHICRPMNGQRRRLREAFATGEGGQVQHPPAHPRCRCALGIVMDLEQVKEALQ